MRVRNGCTIALSVLALSLSSCSSKSEPTGTQPPAPAKKTAPQVKAPREAKAPREEIVGKWKRTDPGKDKEMLVVTKDGKIKKGEPGYEYAGTYKFVESKGDDTLVYEAKLEGVSGAQRTTWKVAVPAADKISCTVIAADKRADDVDDWNPDPERKGGVENYERVQ